MMNEAHFPAPLAAPLPVHSATAVAHVEDDLGIRMPVGARVLHVAWMETALTLWALVDIKAPTEVRQFSVRGTGHVADGLEGLPFLGTVFHPFGLVFHIWDGLPEGRDPS